METIQRMDGAPESMPDQGSGDGDQRSAPNSGCIALSADGAARFLASATPRFLRTSFTPQALHSVLGPAGPSRHCGVLPVPVVKDNAQGE